MINENKTAEKNYKIYDRNGKLVFSSPESCRYSPRTELSIIEAGHTIKLNGKRITKKEIKEK